MADLTGRRIVVTGGASGMGAGLVRALPGRGARVVSLDLNAVDGERIAGEVGIPFIECDVAEPDSVEDAFRRALNHLGGLDVLVHLAGLAPTGSASETEPELWHKVMSVNAGGTYLTNRVAYGYLKNEGGRIINFASGAGMIGYPGKAAYAASKGAVLAWTRTCAQEWGRYAITVNAVCPLIWTPMYDRTRASMTPEQLAAHDDMMARTIPLRGRLGDVEEDLVPVVAFLAGDDSHYMTGQTFVVDGGRLVTR